MLNRALSTSKETNVEKVASFAFLRSNNLASDMRSSRASAKDAGGDRCGGSASPFETAAER